MELYHVLNRGVDKRTIFNTNGDHARFVHDLYEFNDEKAAPDAFRRNMWDFVSPTSDTRKRLVDIHGWCLMKNHYHLLLSEHREGGITKFIRKLNIGYAKYYNDIHQRSGTLFQGRTKKILIENESHFLHILHYIHLNPLDFLPGHEKWRSGNIPNTIAAIRYLDEYRWSSFNDYRGEKNFPSILRKDFFDDAYDGVAKKAITLLQDMDAASIADLIEG
ncbi:MAG: transposase [Minisyncoccia bacterium]